MTMSWARALGGGLLAGALLLAGCAASDSPQAPEPPADPAPSASPTQGLPAATRGESPGAGGSGPASPAAGSYIDYATYQQDPGNYLGAGDVVLFFNAAWCPTCRAAQQNFTASPVPAGLTLVSVDFDDSTALRQQYGVTVQHTFVQVDGAGEPLAKWTGSTTVDQVAAKTV